MLVSEQEERGRKFKLALRAGLPVLLLIGLVAYGTLWDNSAFNFGLEALILIAALIFVTIYFIFFLLEEESRKSLIDPTTNSYNYAAFLHHYKTDQPQSLSLLILDNLNIINENYGAKEIDSMLRSLIYQLDATLAAYGISHPIIGRKHGAKFLIGADADRASLQQAIHSFVTDHPSIEEIEIDLRFDTTDTIDEDLEKTLNRLHDRIRAASDRKFRHSTSRTSSAEVPAEQTDLEEMIVEAIRQERILFSFRPLQQARSGIVDLYEIAVKLQLPDGQDLLPRVYLPIVNRLGFGRGYDTAILKHVLEILPLVDERIAFSFNLSPFSLRSKEFQTKAFELINRSGIDPSRLVIELYERKTHHNLEGYIKILGAFRARGIRICIDNFGSSNASMEYIHHFKFDMVQFDRDYVGRLDDRNSAAILRSMVEMSRDLHILTVAKWVDKEEQKQKLIEMGIDYLQGFGIARPLSEEQLISTYN